MPELPEVETVVRQIRRHLIGASLNRIKIFDGKIALKTQRVSGRVNAVFREGKQAVIELDGNAGRTVYLVFHLRMTGRLIWLPADETGAGPKMGDERRPLKTRAIFIFDRGRLLFVDTRRFGTVRFCDSRDDFCAMGVDPLSRRFTVDCLSELLGAARQPIKTWLLRQDRLVGIGNIYASEILFRAGIRPGRQANRLSSREIPVLRASIIKVLREAIAASGTTFSDFQDTFGETGRFQKLLRVYDREGQKCRVCGGSVRRLVQQQRSSFYCARCQK